MEKRKAELLVSNEEAAHYSVDHPYQIKQNNSSIML